MAAYGRRVPETGKKPGSYVLERWFEVREPDRVPWLRLLGVEPYGIHGTPRLAGAARVITLVPRESVETVGFKGSRPGFEQFVAVKEVRDSPDRRKRRFFVGSDSEFVAFRPRKKGASDDDEQTDVSTKRYDTEPFTEAFVYAADNNGQWILTFGLQPDGTVRAKISPITTRR